MYIGSTLGSCSNVGRGVGRFVAAALVTLELSNDVFLMSSILDHSISKMELVKAPVLLISIEEGRGQHIPHWIGIFIISIKLEDEEPTSLIDSGQNHCSHPTSHLPLAYGYHRVILPIHCPLLTEGGRICGDESPV